MIWILLATVGVPVWLIVGALTAGLLSRKAFKRGAGVFPAKLRLVTGTSTDVGPSWPRMPVYARWVHDVLLVHQGLALVRSKALPVARATGQLVAASADAVSRLGDHPLVLTLVLDDRATVELAAPGDARETMAGPFAGVLM